ncbi:hypothetical protein ACNI3T_00560 [Christiangramia sp. ASW11-125]|uniref:hypothetical protein n=1 Tax=Christiangramia sp. ASW11-125 TaxID=3400701 RepID=UPI003AAB2097
MSRTNIELSKLTDKELAVLVKFKLNRYLPPTQQKILDCAKTRNLTEKKIEKLIKDYKAKKDTSSLTYKIKYYFNEVIAGILGQL